MGKLFKLLLQNPPLKSDALLRDTIGQIKWTNWIKFQSCGNRPRLGWVSCLIVHIVVYLTWLLPQTEFNSARNFNKLWMWQIPGKHVFLVNPIWKKGIQAFTRSGIGGGGMFLFMSRITFDGRLLIGNKPHTNGWIHTNSLGPDSRRIYIFVQFR